MPSFVAMMRFYKCLKIILLCILVTGLNCSGQNLPDTLNNKSVISAYDNLTNSLHLNKIIKVQNLSFTHRFSETYLHETLELKDVVVLTLVPDSTINTPFKFAGAWNQVVSRYSSSGGIYQLLFCGLANCTQLAPENIVINLRMPNSPTIAFTVYYSKGIKIKEMTLGSRDGTGYTEPGDLDDPAVGSFFNHIIKTADLDSRIINGLSSFFSQHKHSNPVLLEPPKKWDSGVIHLKAQRIEGEIVPRLHEIVTINIFITPGADPAHVNISFLFTVLCSGGVIWGPKSADEYKNALPDYHREVSAYGIRLKNQLRSILNTK